MENTSIKGKNELQATEIEVIAMTDDNGNEILYEVLDVFTKWFKKYYILTDYVETIEDYAAVPPADILFMQQIFQNGEKKLVPVEDAKTLERICKKFVKRSGEKFDYAE